MAAKLEGTRQAQASTCSPSIQSPSRPVYVSALSNLGILLFCRAPSVSFSQKFPIGWLARPVLLDAVACFRLLGNNYLMRNRRQQDFPPKPVKVVN
jgi:hypothetical protein